MMPRPITPTVAFGFGEASRVRLWGCRRACGAAARLGFMAGGGGTTVEVAIIFLEHDRRVEQIAEIRRRQNVALRSRGGDPSMAHQDYSLDLRDNLFDVVGD